MLTQATGTILGVAKRAAERSPSSADDPLIAVLFSAMAIEAWLNEFLDTLQHWPAEDMQAPLDRLLPIVRAARLEARTVGVDTRLQVVAAVLTGTTLSLGDPQWQSYSLLFDLRNFLAHQRPERAAVDYVQEDADTFHAVQTKLTSLGQRLVDRGLVAKPDKRTIVSTIGLIQNEAVGKWAFTTASETLRTMISWLPTEPWRQRMLFTTDFLLPK